MFSTRPLITVQGDTVTLDPDLTLEEAREIITQLAKMVTAQAMDLARLKGELIQSGISAGIDPDIEQALADFRPDSTIHHIIVDDESNA